MAPLRILGYADLLLFSTQDASCRWTTSHASVAPTPSAPPSANATPETSRSTTASGSNANADCSAADTCQRTFSEHKGTVFFRAKLPQDTIVAILRHLQEGCGIRATARLVGVHRDTVVRLARLAGDHAHDAHDEFRGFFPLGPAKSSSTRNGPSWVRSGVLQSGRRWR